MRVYAPFLGGLLCASVLLLASRGSAQSLPEAWTEDEPSWGDDALVSGDCLLTLDAGRRERDDGRREYYGALAFTSPWGGCVGARDASARNAPSSDAWGRNSEQISTSPQADGGDYRREMARDLVAPSRAKELDVAEEGPPPEGRVYVVSPRLARDAVAAAWRAAGLSQATLRLDEAESRARWSAALPELRLRAARGFDESARVDYDGEAAGDTRFTGSADLDLEARLTWRLSELVFSGREPSIERLRSSLVKDRRDVARATLGALMRWQRAQTRLTSRSAEPEELADAMLDAAEAEMELSVLTDGWFTSKRVRGAPWMVAHVLQADGASSSVRPVASAPGPGAPPSAPGPRQSVPSAQPSPRGEEPGGPLSPRDPAVRTNPGEAPAPGVNVPRNVVRDSKHAE